MSDNNYFDNGLSHLKADRARREWSRQTAQEYFRSKKVEHNSEEYGFYQVTVLRFQHIDASPIKEQCRISIKDEEYIQVLSEMLYAIQPCTFDALNMLVNDVTRCISEDCYKENYTTAIFLTEFEADVDAILAQYGGREKSPYWKECHEAFNQFMNLDWQQ